VSKSIISGQDALHKLLAGTNLIANAVKATLGPSGRNCVYERVGTNQSVSTRDGVSVANQIEAIDPHEQMAVDMIRSVAREAVDQSGDGTTTATLLAQAIFAEGVKAITVGANPVALKRGIEKATASVVQSLQSMSRPVSGDMVKQVATISANNDEFLGGLIADAMKRAGDDGVVTVEISRKPESELVIMDGLQLGSGYILPEFVNNKERNECILEDVAILLWEKKLATILPARKLMEELVKQGKSLLVVAEDVTDEALGVLAANALKGFKFCAIRTPGSVDTLHDIGALTQGTVFTELLGVKLQDVAASHLGHAKRVVVKPTSTTIIADTGENDALTRRLNELRTQVKESTDEGARLRLQSRLARLVGGVAVIRIGANTELEMLERKDRVEDAMHATRCAIAEGVLIGGGMALLRSVAWLDDESGSLAKLRKEYGEGVEIVLKACHAPIRTLAANSGKSPEYVIERVKSPVENWRTYGWNAKTDTYGDMFEMGILDPLRVVRVALESAASVASLMLITHTLVANERPKGN
jgi:chaperonin GroEL